MITLDLLQLVSGNDDLAGIDILADIDWHRQLPQSNSSVPTSVLKQEHQRIWTFVTIMVNTWIE